MIQMKRHSATKSVALTIYMDFPVDYPSDMCAALIKQGEPGLPIASINVSIPEKDAPGSLSFVSFVSIPPESVDEIVTALYDARRIAKGTLTVS